MLKLSDLEHLRNNSMVRFKEEIVEGKSYTIVSYMIADKSFWEVPLSFETRGITFETDTGKCVSRPFSKFFNVGERVDTDNTLVAQNFVECYEKRDGSMLTPIITAEDNIFFKTKKSFYSDVANTANKLAPNNVLDLSRMLLTMYRATPIFEFTHPDHRIVINYPTDKCWMLLAIRYFDGQYFSHSQMKKIADRFGVSDIPKLDLTWDQIKKSVENDKGIEGYVLLLKDGRRVKYKTDWYLSMHHTMTELRERDVAEAVINENVDDMKSLVASQGIDIAPIENIENQVARELQWLRSEVNKTAQAFIGKTFKDVAISLKGSQFFSLIMSKIRGYEPDYVDFWKRNYLKKYSLTVVYNPSFSR